MQITADEISLEGIISAGRDYYSEADYSTMGSGGSVWIICNSIQGFGQVLAQSQSIYTGTGYISPSAGRIALYVNAPGGNNFSGELWANSPETWYGDGFFGAVGTVYVQDDLNPQGHLRIAHQWQVDPNFYGTTPTVLTALGTRIVAEADSNMDSQLVDSTQAFPEQLAGRQVIHGADPVVTITANDATTLTADGPFGVYQIGESYWGRLVLSLLTVDWDLTCADEIQTQQLNHLSGTIDVLNFTPPKRQN